MLVPSHIVSRPNSTDRSHDSVKDFNRWGPGHLHYDEWVFGDLLLMQCQYFWCRSHVIKNSRCLSWQ
jgi:hypothetical protein